MKNLSKKLLSSVGIELPTDITSASLAIISNEFKPVTVLEEDEQGQRKPKPYYLASPSIGDVLSLKAYIENIIKRLNPQDACLCEYTINNLKLKEYNYLYGELLDNTGVRGDSLSDLEARVKAYKNAYTKLKKDENKSEILQTLLDNYRKDLLDAERELSERKDALAKTREELEAFPPNIPHRVEKLSDVQKCPYCKKEIAIALVVILTDNGTYDKICQLLLGMTLEEAGKVIPISQIKYMWAYLINWVFSMPNNLPTPFLASLNKAMGLLNLPPTMTNLIQTAEEQEKNSINSGEFTPTT